jgi:phosphate starvation-inducible PhoH-like protein
VSRKRSEEATLEEHEKLLNRQRFKPLTHGQRQLVKAIDASLITMVYGPSGTGKGYNSVAYATQLLVEGRIGKLLLTRPAVACEEDLGSLPGSMDEKFSPYMIPLLDLLAEFLPKRVLQEYIEKEIIQLMPLGFMRGITIKNAVVILDEAQNATYKQLRMFLTRIGQGTKMILLGDFDQSDSSFSGMTPFEEYCMKLDSLPGVSVVKLTTQDIVRHELIQHILERLG